MIICKNCRHIIECKGENAFCLKSFEKWRNPLSGEVYNDHKYCLVKNHDCNCTDYEVVK